jgi:hypothetical protein
MEPIMKQPNTPTKRLVVPSREPRNEAEARAFAAALVQRDRKLLESLAKR